MLPSPSPSRLRFGGGAWRQLPRLHNRGFRGSLWAVASIFLHHLCTEHLLCARPCPRCWGTATLEETEGSGSSELPFTSPYALQAMSRPHPTHLPGKGWWLEGGCVPGWLCCLPGSQWLPLTSGPETDAAYPCEGGSCARVSFSGQLLTFSVLVHC